MSRALFCAQVVRVRQTISLANVAGLAKRLEVAVVSPATEHDRDNVVNDKARVGRISAAAATAEVIALEYHRAATRREVARSQIEQACSQVPAPQHAVEVRACSPSLRALPCEVAPDTPVSALKVQRLPPVVLGQLGQLDPVTGGGVFFGHAGIVDERGVLAAPDDQNRTVRQPVNAAAANVARRSREPYLLRLVHGSPREGLRNVGLAADSHQHFVRSA